MASSLKLFRFFSDKDLKSFSSDYPIIALFGKSNVGKSSLLNRLFNHKLARHGKTPGLTELAGFYELSEAKEILFYLVDLPGYGFAKGGPKRENNLQILLSQFLFTQQKSIKAVVFLLDIRRALDKNYLAEDREAAGKDRSWLENIFSFEIPVLFVATKSDKVSRSDKGKALQNIARKYGLEAEDIFSVSTKSGEGLDELRGFLIDYVKEN